MEPKEKAEKKIKEGFVGQKMIVIPPNIKRSFETQALTKSLYLTAIGYYPHATSHSRERKRGCDQYILLYCVNGAGTIFVKGKSFKLTTNHYIILPRNVAHGYSASPTNPWTIYWVHFTGSISDYLYSRYAENKKQPTFCAFDQKKADAFDLIFDLLDSDLKLKNLEVVSLKLQDFIANFIYATEINPSRGEHDKIDQSIAFMKANLDKVLSVETLAKQQNLSVTQYTRLFKPKTGSPPNQYFNELRIQRSCQYLYFSDLSIKEICAELGYSDPYYFSRLFKKIMGMAPNHFRGTRKAL